MEQLAVAEPLNESQEIETARSAADLADAWLVARARAGEPEAFEQLMRRHNQRVYRVVRSVLRDEAEIEDVIQQAYVSAFTHLDQFEGIAAWSTWLCRIAINEALARCRHRGRFVSYDALMDGGRTSEHAAWLRADGADPERQAAEREMTALVEAAVDRLPDIYRSVLVMREIEGMSTNETAAILDVAEDVVKTRLHRARTALRAALEKRIGFAWESAFTFGNQRCDRIVARVLTTLSALSVLDAAGQTRP